MKYFNTTDEAAKEFLLFLISKFIIKLIKIQEIFINIISRDFLLNDSIYLSLNFSNFTFNAVDFLEKIVHSNLHIFIFLIVRVKKIHLLSEFGFCTDKLSLCEKLILPASSL